MASGSWGCLVPWETTCPSAGVGGSHFDPNSRAEPHPFPCLPVLQAPPFLGSRVGLRTVGTSMAAEGTTFLTDGTSPCPTGHSFLHTHRLAVSVSLLCCPATVPDKLAVLRGKAVSHAGAAFLMGNCLKVSGSHLNCPWPPC